jgi:hypothetical protein
MLPMNVPKVSEPFTTTSITDDSPSIPAMTKVIGPEYGGQFPFENCECHLAVMSQIAREIHGRHATTADLTLDGVAVGQRFLQTIQRVGHREALAGDGLRCGSTKG